MRNSLKITVYIALSVAALVLGYFSSKHYGLLMEDPPEEVNPSSSDVPALEKRSDLYTSKGYSKVLIYGGAFVAVILVLGFMVGRDVSQFFGNRALRILYNDEGEGMANPEYEIAEQMWADGHHLEAIRLMREYLQKNPREVHVAIRIAEIYEKDLHNNLAAALEYEEILKQKLPAERWGWAAIHLCNLYFKLGHTDKAVGLLRQIDADYGETAAAEKARKRLAMYDSENPGAVLEEPPEQTSDRPGRAV